MHHLSFKTLILILILLLIPIVFLLRIDQKRGTVLADWYNDAWMYRQAINISTHSTGETNVYIIASVNIGTTTKAQADDGDFRFTDAQGNLLPYFISANTGTTDPEFHIQISNFPSGALTIFAYYGNPSVSNGFSSADFSTLASNYSIGSYSSEETGGGPVAWWKFDEGVGTSAFDSTVNNKKLLLTGINWNSESSCISGKCIQLNGTNSIGTHSPLTNLNQTGFSISGWMKVSSQPAFYSTMLASANSGFVIYFTQTSLTPHLQIYNGTSWIQSTCPTGINLNQWYHLAMTYNSSNYSSSLYLNGSKCTSDVTITNGMNSNYTSTINVGSYASNFHNGAIDDVKIFPYARSAAQIKKDYVTGISGQSNSEGSNSSFGSVSVKSLSNGLVGYWKFDEGVGTTSADSSGNSNLATFATGSSAPAWSSGKYGIGLSFNGTTNYASITHSSSISTTVTTIAAWIKTTSNSNYQMIASKYLSSAGYDFRLQGSNLELAFPGLSPVTITSNSTIPLNTWVHVVGIYNGSKLYLYINGNLDKSVSVTGTPSIGTNNLLIGARSDGYYFNGQLDEVRIYNRALNSDEIKQLYNYAPGPVGYWKFEEGIGTTAIDSSGNNYNSSILGNFLYQPGKFGKSLTLDGTSSYLTTSNIPKNMKDYTYSFWMNIKGDGAAGYNSLIYNTNGGGTNRLMISNSNKQILFQFPNSSDYSTYFSYTFSYNTWYYVSFIKNISDSQYKLYVNGIYVGAKGIVNPDGGSSSFYLGYGGTERFNGKLDEFKIYNYARTNEQILQDMQGDNSSSKLAGPIAWYKFDEGGGSIANNSGIGDTSLRAAFGTSAAAPIWTTSGKFGKALTFTAANNTFVRTPITATNGLNIRGAISYSAWFKRNTTTGYQTIIDMIDNCGSTATDGFYLRFTNTSLYFYGTINDAGGTDPFTLGYTTDGDTTNWHHVVTTWDGTTSTNGTKMYLDGKLVSQSTAVADATNMGTLAGFNLSLGTLSCNTHSFDGLIDEVKIYNYALSSDEIKQDYNAGATTKVGQSSQTIGATTTSLDYCIPGDTTYCASPVAEWKFEEGIGTTAYDSSGNNNSGIFGTGSSSPTWASGKIGKGLNFDGSDFVSSTISQSSIWTASAWVYINSLPATASFVTSINNYALDLQVLSTGAFRLQVSAGNEIDTPLTYSTKTWYYITYGYNGTNAFIYINGVLANSAAKTATTGTTFNIGRRSDGYFFNGLIDNVRIYNYARTPAQIAYDYNKGGPIGWWKFDECQGNISYDSSGIGNTGSISIGLSGTQNSLGTCTVGTSAAWTSGSSGKINGSLNFDGVDDHIKLNKIANQIFWKSRNRSISVWLKPSASALTGNHYFINAYETQWNYLRMWFGISAGKINFTNIIYPGPTTITLLSNNTLAAGTWYHSVITWDDNTYYLYLNGILQTRNNNSVITTDNPQWTTIGGDIRYNRYYEGQIDDVRIYNYALTSEQVKNIYNGGAVNFR